MRNKRWLTVATAALVAIAAAAFAATANATVHITKGELNSSQLRLEGTALPNSVITVDGVALGSSDANGNFKIEKDPYTPPASCVVQVNDGSNTATSVTLAGCTAPTATSPSPPPPPSATAPALSRVTVNPTDVIGGTSATGSVTLSAAAPVGGLQIQLSSDDPAAATVPAVVTVPAGATSAGFPITTNVVANPQSSLIIGTAGGVSTYGIITVYTPFAFANASISLIAGGNGNGTVTSQPAGINCTITGSGSSGSCGAWFPVGTVVRLDARPAANSSFVGWHPVPGCGDPSKVVATRGEFISCQPGFVLK